MAEYNEQDAIFSFTDDLADAAPPLPLPAGDYVATVSKTETAFGKASGKLYARITFTISPENYPVDYPTENEPDGVRLSHMLMLDNSPRTKYKWKLFIEALGGTFSRDVSTILQSLMYCSARVTVEHEEYEGQTQARIKTVTAA